MKRAFQVAPAAIAALLCATHPLTSADGSAAQQASQSSFYIFRGGDTVAVERSSRTATSLEAELTIRGQGPTILTALLAPDATVRRIELRAYAPGAGASSEPIQQATAEFRGDSVIADVVQGPSSRPSRMASVAGAIPYLNPSPSLMEQAIRRARYIGGDSVDVPFFVIAGGRTAPATIRRVHADSVTISFEGVEVRLRVDSAGSILGGTVPAQGVSIGRQQ